MIDLTMKTTTKTNGMNNDTAGGDQATGPLVCIITWNATTSSTAAVDAGIGLLSDEDDCSCTVHSSSSSHGFIPAGS